MVEKQVSQLNLFSGLLVISIFNCHRFNYEDAREWWKKTRIEHNVMNNKKPSFKPQIEIRSGIKTMTLVEQKSRFCYLQSFKIASNDMQNAQIESWFDFQSASSILLSRHNVHIAIHDSAENNKEYGLNTCSVETTDWKHLDAHELSIPNTLFRFGIEFSSSLLQELSRV